MGIPPGFALHQSSSLPGTPDLVSPTSSTYSSRLSEDYSSIQTYPVSPPMSSYDRSTRSDMSAGKDSEDYHTRRDMLGSGPRQQLPSLSSIFGPVPLSRPLPSPHSERPSPLHGTHSPLDRPRSASANPERPYSRNSSYFPSVAPAVASQPRSVYEPRLEPERPALPSVSREFPGPLSPHAREQHEQGRHASRSEASSFARWSHSSHPDPRRSDYVFGSRPSTPSFRSVSERGHLPSLSHGLGLEPNSISQKQSQPPPALLNRSPTLVHSGNPEGMTVKDGLGPKIWTGTHFLPRFVRQAEVQGEGLCYFYDDGTHCKTVIDGEPVNAHWGVTKAGKPRKRLAIACLTCREKKIKCDPDFPRCVQCEKFGRVCKFKNAPRGGHNTSPVTSPREYDEPRQLGTQQHGAELVRQRSTSASVSPRATKPSHPSPEMPGMPAKRMRFSYENYQPSTSHQSPMITAPDIRAANLPWQHRELPRIHEEFLGRKWQTDPYVSDPPATTTIMTSLSGHMKAMALHFLPGHVVAGWAQSDYNAHTTKSPEDLMLVYSLLAFGIHVSDGPTHEASECAEVARFASQRTGPSLQLIQAKLVLSLYYQANARQFDSADMLNGAISTALHLRLNLELHQCPGPLPETFPLGMDEATYAECRRRTFYSCFIWERLNGLSPARPSILQAEDVFIQLPQQERAFDEGRLSPTPTPPLDVHRDLLSLPSDVGMMAHLVLIVEVYGRILLWVQREATRPQPAEPDYLKVLERMAARLRQCQDVLPTEHRFSDRNLAAASEEGREGSLITRHLVWLMAKTKFARHAQTSLTRSLPLEERAQKALALAGDLMYATVALRGQLRSRHHSESPFVVGPFVMCAAVEAVDLMSAGGPVSSIPGSLHELTVAEDLCNTFSTWDEAKSYRAAIERRSEKLALIRERGAEAVTNPVAGCEVYAAPSSRTLMYRVLEPLEARWPIEMDAVYSHSRRT
ncbi:hypothetical protein GGR56DRAFT_129313 [Xylariaceae sp. FL0804]|nr:hypothetical protein GGR56DRAFT_129313 [Xylariaceae sp. FL0804]